MPTKRRRQQEANNPVRRSPMFTVLRQEQTRIRASRLTCTAPSTGASEIQLTSTDLPVITTTHGSFFESPAVRAWYSGVSEAVSTVNTPRAECDASTIVVDSSASRTNPVNTPQTKTGIRSPRTANNTTRSSGESAEVLAVSEYVYSDQELRDMDSKIAFVVPSVEHLEQIQSDAVQAMKSTVGDKKPCFICELDSEQDDIIEKELTNEFVQKIRTCLLTASNTPAAIVAQYCASEIDPRLQGLLLFPPALHTTNGTVWGYICKSCHDCIVGGITPVIPVNAIANGNCIGHLPTRFKAMTRTDEQAVALVLPCVSLSVVTGGACRTIKSHHYIVRNTEGPVVEMLPRNLSSRVRVTMVGQMTNAQVIACKKRYRLDLPLCRRFISFLYQNNCVYKRHQATTRTTTSNGGDTSVTINNQQRTTQSSIIGASSCDIESEISSNGATRLNPSRVIEEASVVVDNTSRTGEDNMHSDVVESIRDESTYSSFGSILPEGVRSADEHTWIGASSVLMSFPQEDFVDVVVRKSSEYVSLRRWAVCVSMFPTLFPCGCGGPDESRSRAMSVRQWVLRCLRMHGHRFETHYAFMLLAFDYLASENARRTLYIRLNVKRQALAAAEIKRSTVVEAIKYFKYLSDCRSKGIKPIPPIEEVQHVIDLRKGLRVPESAHYGSNLGRMRARHDLFGMLKRFGPLQVFFTISPDSAGTYSIAVKSGEISRKSIDEANLMLMPNRAERKRISAQYPVECARYFLRVIDIVIRVFLGWDVERKAPKRGGGIFGVVRAFGASAETQIAGDLHAHFAVWLHGFPATSNDLAGALTDGVFQKRLISLADSVLMTKPPCLQNESRCVRCEMNDTIKPIVPGVDAFRRPAAGALPPVTAMCTSCGELFKDKDIIDASLSALVGGQFDIMNTQMKDFEKCRPPQDRVNAITTSLLVRDVQVHYWNHCRSCFKKTTKTPKGSVCRFLKPETVHLGQTTIEHGDHLILHRPVGCEYVNPYNAVVMATTKCNHDAQFVLSCTSKDTAAYVVKYCFKSQNPVENQVALSLAAFAKAAAKTNALPPDTSPLERGYKILGSMLYTVTNGQEIAAPMAALYILNETPFWFSHDYVRIDLGSLLQKRTDTLEINVSQREVGQSQQEKIPSDNYLERYWKRRPDVENVSFVDICERFEYVRKKSAGLGLPQQVEYARLSSAKVLVICGKEIPDILSHPEPELVTFYYLAVLTLFKPHRQSTLLGDNESALTAYRAFVQQGDSTVVLAMRKFEIQWEDYYRAQRSNDCNDESEEAELLRTRPPPTQTWIPDCSDKGRDMPIDGNVPDDFFDTTTLTAPNISTQTLADDAAAVVQSVLNLDKTMQVAGQAYQFLTKEISIISENFSLDSYRSRITTSATSAGENCVGTHDFIAEFRDAPTRIERLHECFGPVPFVHSNGAPRWTPMTLPEFPEIAMVSEAYQLNFWQHVAFEVAARHLLYAYSQDIADALDEPPFPTQCGRTPHDIKEQFVGYLGGEAGTGKSTVVDALLTFASKWGRVGSVETLAFTGVAAINIKGRTMHSARNLKLNGAEPNTAPSVEMKARFSRVVLVIIDEISITNQGFLGGTDAASRSMSLTPEKIMGGRHVLLIGDLLQLPPIGGSPCFQPPPDHGTRQRQAGYAVYAAINFVVFLTKNMRARFDAVYNQILANLRWGRLSDEDIELLNTRVKSTDAIAECELEEPTTRYRPVVVCTNKLRCAINNDMIFRIAHERNLPLYECMPLPSTRSRLIVENLANINDNLTDRIPMKLLFYLGMPVMLTHKHPDLVDADIVANGVVGTVVGTYPPTTDLPEMVYDVAGVKIHKLLRLPTLLLVRLHNVHSILVEGFPEGVIGLPPLHGSIRIGNIPNLSQSTVTVTQFALVPAFACTTEKLQGQTCHDGVVVTPLDRRRAVPCQTLYVALSRAVKLEGLTLTEAITREYLEKFKPTKAIAAEMTRLIDAVILPPYASDSEILAFEEWKSTQHL